MAGSENEVDAPLSPDERSRTEEEASSRRYKRRLGDIDPPEQGAQIWLISFTDVMALMLTFFVMLYAMSQPESEDWEEMSSALLNEFNKYYGPAASAGPVEAINLERIDFDKALDINYLAALLQSIIDNNESLANLEVIAQSGELVISMPHDLLFEPGEAEIKTGGARVLYALGGSLSRIKNKIEVMGHADPRPISEENTGFASNWELSLARAANVAGVLNSVGYEQNIDVRGLSSGRYEDLADIKDEALRLDISRRVDIVIKNHDGRKSELLFDIGGP